MTILSWDLECSSLNADFGVILCAGFKTVGEGKPHVLNILDYRDTSGDLIKAEKRLLKDISATLLSHDCWLTHFGTWFDINFLNSRLLYHKLPPVPVNYTHIDTWKIAKRALKLRNNRLATLSEFFGTEDEKNAIKAEHWLKALGGHRQSMAYIVEHCRRDVLVLEEVYGRIKCLAVDHPNRGLIDGNRGCSVCSGSRLQARGYRVTRTRKFQRFQCQDCGAWSSSAKPVAKAERS